MSDNQKPSRETGEEVCECGHSKHDHRSPYAETGSCRHQWPGDSPTFCACQTYKPAPKAPVREDREGWLTEDEIVMGTEPLFDTPDSVTIGVTAKRLRALCRMALAALKSAENQREGEK